MANIFIRVATVQIASGTAVGGGKSLVYASKIRKPQQWRIRSVVTFIEVYPYSLRAKFTIVPRMSNVPLARSERKEEAEVKRNCLFTAFTLTTLRLSIPTIIRYS